MERRATSLQNKETLQCAGRSAGLTGGKHDEGHTGPHRRGGGRGGDGNAGARAGRAVPAVAGLSHRPLCAERHSVRQRRRRLLDAAQRARRRHQRRQASGRGMRDRLRHRQGRRMLRAPQGQGPDRRRLLLAALDRHHLRAHREGAGRQDPAADHGLRPLGKPQRRGVRLELPDRSAATGPRPTSRSSTSPRSLAASTSSRARRSASSITTAPTARSRSWRSKSAPRRTASPSRRSRSPIRVSSRSRSGWRSARTVRTTCCSGAGA